MSETSDNALFLGVELLCLDAGNTVIFLDHARLAALAASLGLVVDAPRLRETEGEAKRLLESGGLVDLPWRGREQPGAAGWGRVVATIYARAGVPEGRLIELVEAAWRSHVDYNLWSLVPEGLGGALDAFRTEGGKVAVVSNSEGMLDALFARLGIASHFDMVADSGKLGVEKPDPRIFEYVLRHFGLPASSALHLGDTFATDVLGARAAGLRAALIDPFEHYRGLHEDVPRVTDVPTVARELADRLRRG